MNTDLSRIATFRGLAREHGWDWVLARGAYEVERRSGLQRLRFRQREWADDELGRWVGSGIPTEPRLFLDHRLKQLPAFLFAPDDRSRYAVALRQAMTPVGIDAVVAEAEGIGAGRLRYFSGETAETGFPPDWHANPFTGQVTSPSEHWSRIPMFSHDTGDLKYIWEPGRFSSAFVLARSYWITGDDRHAECFWRMVESWRGANPPNQGAHWQCGQETSLRVMAWCFGLYAFGASPRTTPERVAMLAGMVGAEMARVVGDHRYADLQGNNHSISEGAGLWTAGILFPELADSGRWREQGSRILSKEAARQIYSDGSYIQHSSNYHRSILQTYLWAIRLGRLNGIDLPPIVHDRVERAGAFLLNLLDEPSGHVPNTGSNDGTLILPINGCGFEDYRGVLSVWHYLYTNRRLFEHGPWDEDLIWFFGPQALDAEIASVRPQSMAASAGGYYTLRASHSWGMVRCPDFRSRPSHADGLHLDLWRNGTNVAVDAGTFRYYAEPPWDNGLGTTSVHNTVSVDGRDQMDRGPNFMWVSWLHSRNLHFRADEPGSLAYFEGSHTGYQRLPSAIEHRRAVLSDGVDTWIIVDDLLGSGRHEFRLHWLLADLPFEVDDAAHRVLLQLDDGPYALVVAAPAVTETALRFDLARGDSDSVRGWHSRSYGVRQPALSVALTARAPAPCRMVSIFTPHGPEVRQSVSSETVLVESAQGRLSVELLPPGAGSIVREAFCLRGDIEQTMRIPS